MTERENEYGPWIDHDGKGYPSAILNAAYREGVRTIQRVFDKSTGYRYETPYEMANPGKCDLNHPGWSWKIKRSFATGLRKKLIASDSDYHPIIKYRVIKPPSQSVEVDRSEQVDLLREIAEGKREPVLEET